MIAELKPYTEVKNSGIGWLGSVPTHWHVVRVKQVFFGVDVRSSTGREELLTVSSDRGVVPRKSVSVTMFKAESYVGHKLCWPGDLVINSLWAWAGGLGISNFHGLISSAYGVYRLRDPNSQEGKFFHRLFRSVPFNYELKVRSQGIWTSRLLLSDSAFYSAPIPLPPYSEQKSIARFLNHMELLTERYIRAKEKLITLLEEQKQVMIHDAVTGRIDVCSGKPYPAYKPSGIEWLGDVPNHWKVSRAKRVFWPRTEYARPDDIQLSATQAFGVIAQQKYEERIGRKVTKVLRHLDKRRHVEVDDFVISMRSFQGGVERAWESGCIRSYYIVLRPVTKLSVDYYSHLFKSIGYIAALQLTANFIRDGQDLNFSNFCQVDLPFPPRSEQKEISDALNDAMANIASSINRANREIELLREYRTRLITDVVTGKLDVREAAANLPEMEAIADGSDEKIPAESDSQQSNTTLHNEEPPTVPGVGS